MPKRFLFLSSCVLTLVAGMAALGVQTSRAEDAKPAEAPTTAPAMSKATRKAIEFEKGRAERVARIETVCAQLMKEANDLDNFENATSQAVYVRPHPAVSTLRSEYALDILDRMQKPFTGNEFRDTYIRWHLMYVVKNANQEEKEKMTDRLVQLIKMIPGAIEAEERRESYAEPQDIADRYWSLMNSGNRVIGYPPFQREVGPPESFTYMTGDEKTLVEANFKEAATLKGKFKVITDPKAIAWNGRVRQVNFAIRQYRGELIYTLIFTGDPAAARLVVSEIDRQAKMHSGIAFDLIAYLYVACYDGALDLYEPSLLMELSRQVETSGRSMEGYMRYSNFTRNYADYVYHMVYLLQDGGAGFRTPKEQKSIPSRRQEMRLVH